MLLNKTGLPRCTLGMGFVIGLVVPNASGVWASLLGPTEHKGINENLLSELSAETMKATIGLEGYTRRMRAVASHQVDKSLNTAMQTGLGF